MNYEKVISYLSSKNTENNKLKYLYDTIVNFQNHHFIPSVSFEVALFLRFISNIKKRENTLEIGFGSGVSSIFIREGAKDYNKFITLERDKKRFERGVELLKQFNIDNIELINIDAFDYFKENKLKYDFIFLDAVKGEYHKYIEPVKNILTGNGIFLCDNILFGGKIIDESVEKKYINGVKYLKLFNEKISEDKFFDTFFLPIGDGISISLKR